VRSFRLARVAARLDRSWRHQIKSLPIRHGIWRYSREMRRGDPLQGWKIHLSATILSAGEIFARSFAILQEHDALFKVPSALSFLAQLNSGSGANFSQVGKFITIYTTSESNAITLARKLHHATRGMAAPEIPFDLRYRMNAPVFYRYGAYGTRAKGAPAHLVDPAGRFRPDRRAPGRAIPKWLVDPFNGGRASRQKRRGPIGLDFLVSRALVQRGKGGVFEALDLSTYPARLVIIKQGRRHGDTSWNGEDGFARVEREGRVLQSLAAAGIPVPQVFRQFTQGNHRYLVLEKIKGRPLLRKRNPAKPSWRRAVEIVDKLGTELSKLHTAGWVWRDCKPSHIFVHDGSLRFIDFEGACRTDEVDLLPWGSPDYVPRRYHGKFSRRAGTLEDDYALGVIAFQFATSELPPRSVRRRSAFYKRVDCPGFLRDRIEALLRFE
jgi:hypothetical protein